MKHGVISFSKAFVLALFALPLAARADANPDFDDDARPILQMQPGLLQYVQSKFDVKDTGTAKFPGDDDRRPQPPFIFRARPIGSSGPYNLRLLIQPGAPGHILGVVDITKVHLNRPPGASTPPAVANQQPAPQQPPPQESAPAPSESPATQAPAPAAPSDSSSQPTADTPSGPIMDSGNSQAPASSSSNLAPPPDPAPASQ